MDRHFFIMEAPRIVAAFYFLMMQALTVSGGWRAMVLFKTIPLVLLVLLLLPYVKYMGL